jgi:hypothetical protein
MAKQDVFNWDIGTKDMFSDAGWHDAKDHISRETMIYLKKEPLERPLLASLLMLDALSREDRTLIRRLHLD